MSSENESRIGLSESAVYVDASTPRWFGSDGVPSTLRSTPAPSEMYDDASETATSCRYSICR